MSVFPVDHDRTFRLREEMWRNCLHQCLSRTGWTKQTVKGKSNTLNCWSGGEDQPTLTTVLVFVTQKAQTLDMQSLTFFCHLFFAYLNKNCSTSHSLVPFCLGMSQNWKVVPGTNYVDKKVLMDSPCTLLLRALSQVWVLSSSLVKAPRTWSDNT